MDLDKIDAFVKTLEEANKKLLKKLVSFGAWILISSVIFGIVAGGILKLFDYIGFEKTLILMLLLIVMSNVREQYARA
jgi:predicted branched-subunit amino acid permease